MPKPKTIFSCQSCGFESPKWVGQCPNCSTWNTFEEQVVQPVTKGMGNRAGGGVSINPASIVSAAEVSVLERARERLETGMYEFDRVFSSSAETPGIVNGSVILLGGEPGIGKSTLLTQILIKLLTKQSKIVRKKNESSERISTLQGGNILYISGEESPSQITLRIERLILAEEKLTGISLKQTDWRTQLRFVTSTNVDEVCAIIRQHTPSLVIVDSIQTMWTDELTGAAGSIGQLKESTQKITETVKSLHIPTFLVGHVTKDGDIAGPKVLEHMVDAVVELSGERSGDLRMLRALKNRFGPTDEVGLFQMREAGLVEVTNPSELFLHESTLGVPGAALGCIVEGTRPLLIEVQALVVKSYIPMPRRVAQGIPLPRLQVLTAVLQKHVNLSLHEYDVFVSIAGGLSTKEPSLDLAVCLAIISSLQQKPLPAKTVSIGEVGLLGEVRQVPFFEKRRKEAIRLGFPKVISAEKFSNLNSLVRGLW